MPSETKTLPLITLIAWIFADKEVVDFLFNNCSQEFLVVVFYFDVGCSISENPA